jgi:predicted PurR-regulated permease PerM
MPETLADIESSEWFVSLEASMGIDLTAAMQEAWLAVKEGVSFLAVSGGLLQAGVGVIGAISSGFLVVVLTLYFVASLETMKQALAGLIPAYRRTGFTEIIDEITGSVGVAIGGAVILSLINASVVFVIQFAVGSSVPFLIAVSAFFITLVPLAGSVIFLAVGTLAAFVTAGPTAALVFLVAYFVYVQIEAYYVTPKVMGKAVAVPAVLIIIGAMAGATLFGFLGALVAIPITASVLIILRKVVVPRQTARTERIEI